MDVKNKFRRVELGQPRSAIVRIVGQEGTGKSSLALTAPGPIGYIETSENWLTACHREKARGEALGRKTPKEISLCHAGYLLNQVDFKDTLGESEEVKQKVREAAGDALVEFNMIWIYALMNFRTVVLDNDKAMTDLVHFWAFGNAKGDVPPSEYERPNRVFKGLLNSARDLPCKYPDRNVIFIGQVKEDWGLVPGGKDGKKILGKTGKWSPVGKDALRYFPEVMLHLELDKEQARQNRDALPTYADVEAEQSMLENKLIEASEMKLVNPYSAVIQKAGRGGALHTLRRIPGDECTWGQIMGKLTDTKPEVWEEELPPRDDWQEADLGEIEKILRKGGGI